MKAIFSARITLLCLLPFFVGAGCPGCPDDAAKSQVNGAVELAPELQAKLEPSAVLYVVARPAEAAGGPPLAVKRFVQPLHFPLEFDLSKKDVMIPDSPFQGKVKITARISQAGSAMPVRPGDIQSSQAPVEVEVGADQKIAIRLDQLKN